MIFGRPGSGKSTFATWLSNFYPLPIYHLDKYFYIRNWLERDYNEFLEIQENIVNSESWIIDEIAYVPLKCASHVQIWCFTSIFLKLFAFSVFSKDF